MSGVDVVGILEPPKGLEQRPRIINIQELRDRLSSERLNPRTEKDNDGFDRKIYSINGVTFSFKGREELPIYPTLINSRTTLLGEAPKQASREEFNKYQDQLEKTGIKEKSPQHFVVNKTLLGVVELAIQLGSKDLTLPGLVNELRQGIYSQRSRSLLDALIATNYSDFAKSESSRNNNAEAVVTLSLLGDDQAQAVVTKSVESVERQDSIRDENIKRYYEEEKKWEPLHPEELCVVHVTDYDPEANKSGFSVRTRFDASGGKIIRNTIHTALNHKVLGFGSDDLSRKRAKYTLIAPFQKMLEVNGIPRSVNTVDTYWTRDPGEPLVFAGGTMVAPGGSEINGLYEGSGNIIRYKSQGLNTRDLADLIEKTKRDGYFRDLASNIRNGLEIVLYPEFNYSPLWDLGRIQTEINQFLSPDVRRGSIDELALLQFLTAQQKEGSLPIETVINDLVVRSGVMEKALNVGVRDKEVAKAELIKKLSNAVTSAISAEISELAVRDAIKKEGFMVRVGGMKGWVDSPIIKNRARALGLELGVSAALHNDLPEGELENIFFGKIGAGNGNYDELVPSLDPKTRRVLYASGSLT